MSRRSSALRVVTVCAHTYEGMTPVLQDCDRCGIGWNKRANRCDAYLGVEHIALVASTEVPACLLSASCQHQVQEPGPCKVRARGLVCELGLIATGMSIAESMDHPLAFNANFMEEE